MISEPCPAPVTATEDDIPPKNTSTRQISMWVPKFYEKSTWTIQKTLPEAKKVLRKIDWHIVPLAAWACGLQFVDKSGLGAAATYRIQTDIGLVSDQYSWSVSIFYFGYLAGAFVSGRGLQYFHAGKYIGVNFFLWGATLLGCFGVQNYATFLALAASETDTRRYIAIQSQF